MPEAATTTLPDGREIARWRVHVQRLGALRFDSVPDAVQALVGVQAENHGQAAWAVATRTTGTQKTAFDQLFDDGAILRTHVLRPTWHYVHPEDIRWLLDLTGPRIRPAFRQLQRTLGVSDDEMTGARKVIVDALGDGHRTRGELRDLLVDAGLDADGPRLGLFAADAELEALICSGPTRGGAQTYALLAERAPDARVLDRDAALAELAFRYFSSRGPATERDLAVWATLTLADVRQGLAAVADRLDSFQFDGRRYWFTEPPPTDPPEPRGHLLLVLDELYRAYHESREHIDVEGLIPPGDELSVGMSLVDGQILGGMRRHLQRNAVRFDVLPFRSLAASEEEALTDAGRRYGAFLGLEPEVRFIRPMG